MDRRTRRQHRVWHGTILPVDHPWWQTHFPPCGWNCRCSVTQLSERDLTRYGWKVTEPPVEGPPTRWYRPGSDTPELVPAGIDPGFAYNPGEAFVRAMGPVEIDAPLSAPVIIGLEADRLLPPLPPVRYVGSHMQIPRDTPPEQAIDRFMKSFTGTKVEGGLLTKDAMGEPLVINDRFFYRGGVRGDKDTEKLVDLDRIQNMPLIAESLKNPDEIWWVWEDVKVKDGPSRWRLTRRYVARFDVEGKAVPFVVVMAVGRQGWSGVTGFVAHTEKYLNKPQVRGGVLAYRRT